MAAVRRLTAFQDGSGVTPGAGGRVITRQLGLARVDLDGHIGTRG